MTGTEGALVRLAPQQRYLAEVFAGLEPECAPRAILALKIEGNALNVEELRIAADRLAANAAILRTRFPRLHGLSLPVQSIAPLLRPEIVALEESSDDPLGGLWRSAIDQESSSPLTIALGSTHLVLRLPALCADAHTLDTIAQSLLVPGIPDSRSLEFFELAEWLCDFTREPAAAERAWWHDRICPVPRLPFERPNGLTKFEALHWTVPSALDAGLSRLAGSLGVDQEACWLAVWWIVLARIAQARLSIAVEFDGRRYDGLEHCLGPLARRAPLAWSFDGELPVRELIRQIHRDLALGRERIEYYDPPADGSLGRFGFAWRAGRAAYSGRGTTLRPLIRQIHAGPFVADLCLERRHLDGESLLEATLLLDGGSLQVEAADELKRLTMDAAATVVDDVSASMQELRFASRRSSAVIVAQGSSLLDPLAALASTAPDRAAVVDEADLLTFGSLWDRAGRLAFRLKGLGAGPERVVALLMPRVNAAVVAMIAAWRCGAAYMPLDPALPPLRLASLLKQMPVAAVVVSSEYAGQIPEVADLALVRMDGASASDRTQAVSLPEVIPKSCAYLLSTSGSTGAPKVVAVEHRQLHAYALAVTQQLKIGAGWRFGIVSPWFADIGMTMLAGSLVSGGSLHIMPEARLLNADAFGAFVREHRLHCLKIVPSHLQALLAGSERTDVLPSELLILGGEQPSWSLIRQIAGAAPHLRLANHYGPTETTVGVAVGEIDPSEADHLPRPLIGRALSSACLHILDDGLNALPTWMPGQIYVAGETVSRGYAAAPGATAKAYLPDPFAVLSGSRMYATGDLARRHLDGRIEFLGRCDRQVKIRGLRAEPGELEAALLSVRGVVRAAVVVRGEQPFGVRLIAYVVPALDHLFDAAAIRRELADKLPPYLLPSSITPVGELPLTATGKLDVARLPPEANRPGSSLLTGREREIGSLWCEVLGTTSVGREDSFFELGGHSLALAQLSLLFRDRLGLDFPLPELFRHPTVAAMARMADKKEGTENSEVATKALTLAAQRREAMARIGTRAEQSKGAAR